MSAVSGSKRAPALDTAAGSGEQMSASLAEVFRPWRIEDFGANFDLRAIVNRATARAAASLPDLPVPSSSGGGSASMASLTSNAGGERTLTTAAALALPVGLVSTGSYYAGPDADITASVTGSHPLGARQAAGAATVCKRLEPESFISAFEGAITELSTLQRSNQRALAAAAADTKEMQAEHTAALQSLSAAVEALSSTFRKIDKRVSRAAQAAVTVGTALEAPAQLRAHTLAGKALIRHVIALDTGDLGAVDPLLLTQDPQHVHEAARLVLTLRAVLDELAPSQAAAAGSGVNAAAAAAAAATTSRNADSASALPFSRASALLATLATSLELTIREQLASALRAGKLDAARRCATTLHSFPGNTFQRYVFDAVSKLDDVAAATGAPGKGARSAAGRVAAAAAAAAAATESAEAGAGAVTARRGLPQLKPFTEGLRTLTSAALDIIKAQAELAPRIFPEPAAVVQSIAVGALSRVHVFIDEQLGVFATRTRGPGSAGATGGYAAAVAEAATAAATAAAAAAGKDKERAAAAAAEAMAKVHIARRAAATEDMRVLKLLGGAFAVVYELVVEIVRCIMPLQQQQQQQQQQLTGGKPQQQQTEQQQQLAVKKAADEAKAAAAAGAEAGIVFGDDVDATLVRELVSGVFATHSRAWLDRELDVLESMSLDILESIAASREEQCPQSKDVFGRLRRAPMDPPVHRAWLVSQLTLEPVERVLRQAAAAVRRSDGLAQDADAAVSATARVALTVGSFLHERFMAPMLREALALLPPRDPKQAPDHFFFIIARQAGQIASRELRFRQRYVLPRVAGDPSARSSLDARLAATRRESEALLLAGLEAVMSASLSFMRRTLTGQRPNFYRPRADADAGGLDSSSCPAWDDLCDQVTSMNATASFALQGANLDRYLLVYGTQVYALVVDHVRRHCGGVSTLGAPLLRRDITVLSGAIAEMRLPKLDALFADLRALCDLFFVPLTSLRALVTEGSRLSGLPAAILLEFARLRADYAGNKALVNAQLSVLMQGV